MVELDFLASLMISSTVRTDQTAYKDSRNCSENQDSWPPPASYQYKYSLYILISNKRADYTVVEVFFQT